MSKDEKAIIPKETIVPDPIIVGSVDSLMSQAIAAGASIDTLERLMALRKEMLSEAAKQAFNEAMASFQAQCPMIEKKKSVDNKYKYAPIDSIVSQVKDVIEKHGFRYSTTMKLDEAGNKVTAIVRVVHKLGHEETSEMEVPLGSQTAIMSSSQRVAAATTFAKRYAFLNAFGIMTGDEDNDAKEMKSQQPDTMKDLMNHVELCVRYEELEAMKPEIAKLMQDMDAQQQLQVKELCIKKASTFKSQPTK